MASKIYCLADETLFVHLLKVCISYDVEYATK